MSTWLDAWRSRARRAPSAPVIELLVVAGADAGNVFTLEGDEILVGRGQPESGRTERVQLADRSISRRQAWIRRDESGTTIEHIDAAANPTMLNGRVVTRARLEAGDRIEMGRVAIDVRAREGMNLRGLTQIMEAAARESTRSPTTTEATDSPGAGATSALEGRIRRALERRPRSSRRSRASMTRPRPRASPPASRSGPTCGRWRSGSAS